MFSYKNNNACEPLQNSEFSSDRDTLQKIPQDRQLCENLKVQTLQTITCKLQRNLKKMLLVADVEVYCKPVFCSDVSRT